ncbi:11S globulin-like protein [Striga asiatica]|uniref:11S globulin-like protein n=1 Tax=Striga asiatica TaxID=4170 RepID=A0A5A7NWF9_STRAF|nr:11S globulin-like protein [Striga asiatica]
MPHTRTEFEGHRRESPSATVPGKRSHTLLPVESHASFFLAGNTTRGQHQEQHRGQGRPHLGNDFRGFCTETIAEVFKVGKETARKLQGQNNERGHIVTGDEGLQVIRPPSEYNRRDREEEKERYYGGLKRV